MADGKKSFILYCDILHVVKKLPKDKAGELFLTILQYVNDLNPEVVDFSVELVFEPIKQQLKRDLKKWDNYIEKQSYNGKLGGRPNNPKKPSLLEENQNNPKKPSLLEENQNNPKKPSQPKKADNATATANVNVSDNVTFKEENTATAAAVGGIKVKEVANKVWADKLWIEQVCPGLSISPAALQKWMAQFNSTIADDSVDDFTPSRYKRMVRGWIAKQQAKGVTVETELSKKSDSAPLTRLKN